MQQIDINKRSIGVNFNAAEKAEVLVWAPKAQQVALQLSDSSNTVPLKAQEYGYWSVTTDQLRPGGQYKFLLNNKEAYPDPASLSQPGGVHTPSQAFNLKDFRWTDEHWNNLPQPSYIFYELHTGTFTNTGTFSGLEKRLDYLVSIGINAIEIMPVAQFAGGRNWGYDGVYPFAVQDTYGGAEGLQRLVNACHSKGIAVVLDVVYNHLGPEGNYLDVYGHYFTDKYNTPWGNAINFDDAWSDAVRQYFIENVLMWFRDFHIDALRLDAVHAIKDLGSVHILQEIKQQVDALMQATGKTHYLIVELDLNDIRFINPQHQCGFGMDAQWIDEFHHALRVTAGNERSGYYEDFDGLQHLAKAYTDAYVFDGIYSPHRKKKFGVKATDNPGEQFIVFSQNHDQVGNRMLGERTSVLVSFEMQKLLAGAVLCSPYLPMLFMGEEYGETNPFQYFVSHTDAELAQAVREGRKKEFAAFHLQGEAPDPVAEETFNGSKLNWERLNQEPHQTMLAYYKLLISLRKQERALYTLDRRQVEVTNDQESQTLALHRWHNDEHILCVMNFSQQQQHFTLPTYADEWHLLCDSASPEWNGPKAAAEQANASTNIVLQPEAIVVYKGHSAST